MSITALTSHNLVFSQELETSRSVGPSLRPNFLEQEPGSVLQIWCGKHRANIDD
ncbi:U5 snRNP component [Aspergillus luchuensis]|uniref:U5 snRNP component n=1 Tax=Aspergillus kawachii TaxID=1069201 RepID=A0A146F9Z3_ASPKA|nr:U5 snRNP component [Aspergillus luchuensis]